MPALADIVLTPAHADAFIAGCEQLAEARITGLGGLRGTGVIGAYAISKAADMQLARNLAQELSPNNIRVNCIAPGLVKTDFAKALWDTPAGEQRASSATDARAARVKNPAVKSVYARLRHGAEREVDAALPQFAELLARQLRAAA